MGKLGCCCTYYRLRTHAHPYTLPLKIACINLWRKRFLHSVKSCVAFVSLHMVDLEIEPVHIAHHRIRPITLHRTRTGCPQGLCSMGNVHDRIHRVILHRTDLKIQPVHVRDRVNPIILSWTFEGPDRGRTELPQDPRGPPQEAVCPLVSL